MTESSPAPVYISFSTFKSGCRGLVLADGALPEVIDKSLLGTMSGANQSLFMAALEKLQLIDDRGHPTQEFAAMVRDESQWKPVLKSLLERQYAQELQLLKSGTPSQLEDALGAKKFGNSLISKAVRFLLQAADESGFEVGKQHRRRKRSAGSRPKRQPSPSRRKDQAASNGDTAPDANGKDQVTPPGLISFPVHLRGKPAGSVQLPSDFEPHDVPMLEAVVAAIRVYAEGNLPKSSV